MDVEFSGEVFEWRGPAPHHFVAVPDEESAAVEATAGAVSYGWGMIPVTVRIGGTSWTTSLWPREGRYVVPLKLAVRKAEGIDLDDVVEVRLTIDI
ncbi:hypothetical protein ABIE44_000938 [Marmoricola sp. OAE513]|uniref:DUF1905 domain-containing protein n=1 Tax=Marmoricola sp. OAE513 TaxID=2817894 RepID=UPI001AEA42EA